MKRSFPRMLMATLAGLLVVWAGNDVFGRGGRGGGGGGRMGGGGMSRPSMPSRPSGGMSRPSMPSRPPGGMSRPSTPSRPSMPSAGMSRPSGGSRPSFGSAPSLGAGGTRPSTRPSTRPGTGARPGGPGLQPGTRPGGGTGIATRPSTRPGTGTGIGSGAGIGDRPATLPGGGAAGTRPATRPGVGTGIAAGVGAGTLPGLGGRDGSRLPNEGSRVQDRMADRPQTLEGRRADLSDRMATGRENWQDHRGDGQFDRQDWRDQNREDWQDMADQRRDRYGDWYNDARHDDWHPGSGWDYMWDNYPAAAAIGLTRWGVNRVAYGFGYWGYYNPYVAFYPTTTSGYSYSEPLVSYASSPTTIDQAPADTAAPTAITPPATDEGLAAFEQAREAFYAGEFEEALKLLDITLKTMPQDTVVHEFRSLVLFALKRYPESAAAIYAVLSAGPGWDWTTLSGLYPSVDIYTSQLRALEAFAKANPKSADASFLLGYHYLTMGHSEQAHNAFRAASAELPDDRLISQLVEMTRPPGAEPTTPPARPEAATPDPAKAVKEEQLVGTWNASGGDANFELTLTQAGAFTWTYARGDVKESVQGVFAIDQDTLALEPNAGGTMLAEVTITNPTQFTFRMVGAEADDKGLEFKKL